MKLLIPFTLLALFFLGACEEIIIEKFVTDTIYVDRPRTIAPVIVQTTVVDTVFRDLIRVDTVEVRVVVIDTVVNNVVQLDTVIQIQTDSVFIETIVEKIVNHYDTILTTRTITLYDTIYLDKIVTVHDTITTIVYDRTVSYLDTFWIVDPFNMVTFIPNEVLPYVVEFSQSCWDRGLQVNSMPLLVQYSNNLPGENWSSFSYIVGFQQMIIEISDKLPAEQQRAGILREMNRLQRNKKYTTIPDRIMNPLFDPAKVITKAHLDELYR